MTDDANIIGLIIIAIGLYEAWKINKGVPVSGPFRFDPAVAVVAPVLTGGAPPPAAAP